MTFALQLHAAFADNRLQLRKENHVLTINLSNTDPIAGFQFTVNARGGIDLKSCGGGDRAAAAGLAVYQYLKDDSTLNIIMLAPVGSSLPAGEGILSEISFELRDIPGADTIVVFLSQVVVCNANAEYLEITSADLSWNISRRSNGEHPLFVLERNFPNPFNPSTTIAYKLEEPAEVQLAIFDISGRELNILVDQRQSAGRYAVRWTAAENGGLMLASGVYFARLKVDDHIAFQKMILMK